jgi:hypothetical protein
LNGLLLKLVLTPALIGGASLAGRRWGAGVSGWLVGLPLTSAPIAVFLALEQGGEFAATAAVGTMAGTISQAAFSVAYAWLAFRRGPAAASVAGIVAFAASTAVLERIVASAAALFIVAIVGLLLALRLMPAGEPGGASRTPPAPAWDIPARMAVATAFVLLLTGFAAALGPRLTGLLAPFPLYAAILAVFAHRLEGPGAAARLLKGLLLGLFGFAAFFLVFASLMESAGLAVTVAAATAVTGALQAASFRVLRRGISSRRAS